MAGRFYYLPIKIYSARIVGYLCTLHFFYFLPDLSFNFRSHFRVVYQELANSVTALPQFITIIAKPATTFLNDAEFNAHINDFSSF